MKRLFVLVLLVSFLFGGFEQRSKIDLSTDQLIEVQITVFETSSSERALWKSNERVEIVDGQITDIDAIVPDAFKDRPELWLTVEYDGRMLTDERVMLTSSALRRESPTEPSETSEEMATHLKIGRPGETDDLVVYSPQVGFGVDTPSERIDVEGAIAIREGSSPTSTTDVGKVYVNDADGHLYFIDEAGNITDLTVDANALQSVSSSAYTTGRTDHMRIIPGRGTDVTESATNDTIYISYNVDVTSGGLPPCSSAPSMPDAMEGASIVCTGEPGAAYAVPPVESATFYRWTIPGDAVITSGIGTNAVNIVFGSTDGTVCARAVNSCGTSSDRCMSVSINRPTSPGSITGTSPVCAGQTGVSYYIASVPGATNYIWTLPPGAVLASGTGTPNITVNFGTSGGDICVQTENSCGTSTPVCMPVVMTTTPSIPGVITGSSVVCEGETGVSYSISSVAEATSYTWTVPSGATITAGDGTEAINVTFGTTGGDICVTANSICGSSSARCLSVTVNSSPEITAHPSDVSVDEGDPATFSVSATGAGLIYQWQRNTGSAWADLSGGTSSTYTESSPTESMDGYQYRCIVTGSCSPSDTSTAATLTVTSGLFTFSSFTFTNCGATGRDGPTLSNCGAYYSGQPWYPTYFNVVTRGIQEWTVPADGTYRITCAGAQGGDNDDSHSVSEGGDGALMVAEFDFARGDVLQIAVGQRGIGNWSITCNTNAGGGGGSFVVDESDNPLIVAGGGGGAGGSTTYNPSYIHASTGTCGNTAPGNSTPGPGGCSGNGGQAGMSSTGSEVGGSAGAGFNTDGEGSAGYSGEPHTGGDCWSNGMDGGYGTGTVTNIRDGGFGGGGATNQSCNGGGGGGGYSGGGGGEYNGSCSAGGGGGSYIAPSGTTISTSVSNTGNGYVTIELIP